MWLPCGRFCLVLGDFPAIPGPTPTDSKTRKSKKESRKPTAGITAIKSPVSASPVMHVQMQSRYTPHHWELRGMVCEFVVNRVVHITGNSEECSVMFDKLQYFTTKTMYDSLYSR